MTLQIISGKEYLIVVSPARDLMQKAEDPNQIVKKGYDSIYHLYHQHRDIHKIDQELKSFVEKLPIKGLVLDAGVGAGVPGSQFLIKHGLEVIGVDISKKMIQLAKTNVPEAQYYEMDIRNLEFPAEKFDGVMSLFTLFHIPKSQHSLVLKEFYRILKLGGKLMINSGIHESEGITGFFGVPMYWSSNSPDKLKEIIDQIGFKIEFEGILERGGELQYWIFAEK